MYKYLAANTHCVTCIAYVASSANALFHKLLFLMHLGGVGMQFVQAAAVNAPHAAARAQGMHMELGSRSALCKRGNCERVPLPPIGGRAGRRAAQRQRSRLREAPHPRPGRAHLRPMHELTSCICTPGCVDKKLPSSLQGLVHVFQKMFP